MQSIFPIQFLNANRNPNPNDCKQYLKSKININT